VILYGAGYWNEIINFEALVRHGMIERKDLGLFQYAGRSSNRAGAVARHIASGTR